MYFCLNFENCMLCNFQFTLFSSLCHSRAFITLDHLTLILPIYSYLVIQLWFPSTDFKWSFSMMYLDINPCRFYMLCFLLLSLRQFHALYNILYCITATSTVPCIYTMYCIVLLLLWEFHACIQCIRIIFPPRLPSAIHFLFSLKSFFFPSSPPHGYIIREHDFVSHRNINVY